MFLSSETLNSKQSINQSKKEKITVPASFISFLKNAVKIGSFDMPSGVFDGCCCFNVVVIDVIWFDSIFCKNCVVTNVIVFPDAI